MAEFDRFDLGKTLGQIGTRLEIVEGLPQKIEDVRLELVGEISAMKGEHNECMAERISAEADLSERVDQADEKATAAGVQASNAAAVLPRDLDAFERIPLEVADLVGTVNVLRSDALERSQTIERAKKWLSRAKAFGLVAAGAIVALLAVHGGDLAKVIPALGKLIGM